MEDQYIPPMLTSDAAAMLRRKVQTNDRPFIAETTKANNRLVDEWKEKVLDEISDSKGRVLANKVGESWQLFLEGKYVTKYSELREKGVICTIPEDVKDFWKEFFETLSPTEMHEYGSATVNYGWTLITTYIRMWFVDQKWEKLYSKSDDPLYWEKNHFPHNELLQGRTMPFWSPEEMREIGQKVAAVLMNEVKPQGSSSFK